MEEKSAGGPFEKEVAGSRRDLLKIVYSTQIALF